MYQTVVAIDLETTGIDPLKDGIMEFGAAVMVDGVVTDRFSELVRVGTPPPLQIQRLTGITPAMLKDARPIDAILPEFMAFLDRGPEAIYIAHNAAFDREFLLAATKGDFSHIMLDTVGLARIIYPLLPSHSLGYLVEQLALPQSNAHRAMADCETELQLWQAIEREALAMPLELIAQLNYLIAPYKAHPFYDFFQKLEVEVFAEHFSGTGKPGTLVDLFQNHKELIDAKRSEPDFDRAPKALPVEKVCAMLREQGAVAENLEHFEERPGQLDMVEAVATCFNESRHLMVEAPTGIGKSMAYLLPSILFAKQEGWPVVISTNTKNLQQQLFEKDIPLLAQATGIEFKSALIKGRGNYLCLRKLQYILHSLGTELDREERMQMLVLLSWATKTKTGDISECVLTGRPNFGPLWAKLRTLGDECAGRSCKTYHRCFLRRARALSLGADVVVANHALVFSELNMESSVLPEYRHVVFDEAHNLENVATDHLSVELSQSRIMQVLLRLFRTRRGKKGGTGLVPNILFQLNANSCTAPDDLASAALDRATAVMNAVDAAIVSLAPFFSHLVTTFGNRGDDKVRFAAGRKLPRHWDDIMTAKEAMVSALAGVMRSIEALVEVLAEIPTGAVTYLRDFQRELEAVGIWVKEVVADVEFVLAGTEANYVYWIEQTHSSNGGAMAKAAPVSIAELMNDQVYARKRSCIFSSATLSIRGKFDFLAGRLGINKIDPEGLRTISASTPFDFDAQCMVAAPTFLPEPSRDSKAFEDELSRLMGEVYRRTHGRGMMLFTSYAMLRDCHERLLTEMQGDGYTILAQGASGSREQVTATFIRDIHSILLGTHSFWEGVDVVGESLSCLTIARLPFQAFREPIFEARCEQLEAAGKDAFIHYSIPMAVIRFRQGFGRLIRSRRDRGMVIIADPRVYTKRYGRVFLESLPTRTEAYRSPVEFLHAVEDFFGEDASLE